jgi:hypothetical protein
VSSGVLLTIGCSAHGLSRSMQLPSFVVPEVSFHVLHDTCQQVYSNSLVLRAVGFTSKIGVRLASCHSALITVRMRLLQIEEDSSLSLIERVGGDIPPYVILSHTWGDDGDEVTFKDMKKSRGKDKVGYQKIEFCMLQTLYKDLRHFWVDTCCIDKSSSAELSEAINSMYRWYHESKLCVVYLSDVVYSEQPKRGRASEPSWADEFRRARWFSRGWTLQELLAPTDIAFFSSDGVLLGRRFPRAQLIHEATGINIEALQGRPISTFSVDERLSWATGRKTKREEDLAYSLLGLFDVHMPLIYGEGQTKALLRLKKEIDQSRKDLLAFDSGAKTTKATIQDIDALRRRGKEEDRPCNIM